jgi:hypothetical protein
MRTFSEFAARAAVPSGPATSAILNRMTLYADAHFTFRFAEARIVPRFHLEGVPPGTPVLVRALGTGASLARAAVGPGGWVELAEPLVVRPGEGFEAVPSAGAPC